MLRKKHKSLILFLITLILCSASVFAYCIDQNKRVGNNLNPYFFKQGTISVEYDGYFYPISGTAIEQKTTLNIINLKDFEDGSLYALILAQLDVTDPYDKISLGREHLGFFFVTKETIYRVPLSDYDGIRDYEEFINSENNKVIEIIQRSKNEFLSNSDIVCIENGTSDVLIDGEWHKFVKVDGNKRVFRYYSDYSSGTRYYERIVWEKGKGIIHYKSGFGSMLTHVEFGENLLMNIN